MNSNNMGDFSTSFIGTYLCTMLEQDPTQKACLCLALEDG